MTGHRRPDVTAATEGGERAAARDARLARALRDNLRRRKAQANARAAAGATAADLSGGALSHKSKRDD
jgi:hypothetical protein